MDQRAHVPAALHRSVRHARRDPDAHRDGDRDVRAHAESNQTPFDQFVGGNPGALSQLEQQGLQIFSTIGRCNVCHGGPFQTDNLFHYDGVRPQNEDLGRFNVTGNPGDRGAMKTPGLRNVELRAPYFHNGRMATLSDVIDFYDRGGDFNAPNKPPAIAPIGLSAQQKSALLAFLKRPLTDPRVPAQAFPFDRPTLASERNVYPTHYGAPTAGAGGFMPQIVAFEPAVIGTKWTVGIDRGNGGRQAVLLESRSSCSSPRRSRERGCTSISGRARSSSASAR